MWRVAVVVVVAGLACALACACAARPQQRTRLALVAELRSRACDAGVGSSCTELGEMYLAARGASWDASAAQRAFARGCELGDPAGCRQLVREWAVGDHAEYLRRGCALGDPAQCLEIGDTARADALRSARCRAQSWQDCEALSREIGSGLLLGGLTRAEALAEEAGALARRACAAGDALACAAVDGARAHQLDDAACAAGDVAACERFVPDDAESAGHERRLNVAQRRECDAGDAERCIAVAGRVADEALDLYQRACDQLHPVACQLHNKHRSVIGPLSEACLHAGWAFACGYAGNFLLEAGAHEDGLLLLQRGCELGDGGSCAVLADRRPDVPAARRAEWLGRACDHGAVGTCYQALGLVDRGELEVEPGTVPRWLRSLCDFDAAMCVRLADMIEAGEATGDAAAVRREACTLVEQACP